MIKTFVFSVMLLLGASSDFLHASGTLPPVTGTLAHLTVCKAHDVDNPVTGTFQFTVTGYAGILYAAPGTCSSTTVQVPFPFTVTELSTPGTELIAVKVEPDNLHYSFNLAARTVTVSLPAPVSNPVVGAKVYFKNRPAPVLGNQGCTPGYWKNHLEAWPATGYSPDQKVGLVFIGPLTNATQTLLQALQSGGGSGLAGAQAILLRAGVAALLNAAHGPLTFSLTASQVISQVNTALASNNRNTILALADQLDRQNNGPGGCPLGSETK